MTGSILADKALTFAYGVIEVCAGLDQKTQYVVSKQLMASGTAIGALVSEAQHCESRADFIHKMKIASKEASETAYWLHISRKLVEVKPELFQELEIIQKMLTKSITTAKKNLNNHQNPATQQRNNSAE